MPISPSEPTGLWSIEPRTLMATRRDLEEIVPARDGVRQEETTARDCPSTVRGLLSNSVSGAHATAGTRWLKSPRT
jgi:hypothetical protein